MTEYYAKIVPIETGIFKYCSTIWKSDGGIESIWGMKRFFTVNKARLWSEKKLSKAVSIDSNIIFIKESDILRRKWND